MADDRRSNDEVYRTNRRWSGGFLVALVGVQVAISVFKDTPIDLGFTALLLTFAAGFFAVDVKAPWSK